MGDVIYGKNMRVDGEKCIDFFEIKDFSNAPDYVTGCMQGAVGRVAGNHDWEGEYRMYDTPVRFPNDEATFKAAPVNTGNKGVSGTARIVELTCRWDMAMGAYIEYRIGFGSNGVLTRTGIDASLITPVTSALPLSPKGMLLKLDDVVQDHVSMMGFRIFAEVIPYVDSTTDGQTHRTLGDIDVSAMWLINSDDPANWPTKDAYHVAKFYVTATTFWEFKFMHIMGVRPWTKDRRQKDTPVQFTALAAFKSENGTDTGYIKNPALQTKWPAA